MTTIDSHQIDCQSVTRRRFLASLGATVAVATAGSFGISVWGRDPSRTSATAAPPLSLGPGLDRTLVVIEMGGGNDGLNTVVPYADDRYHDLRGSLAIAAPLELDSSVGLHPELSFLAAEYATGRVAIVEGVGYPEPDLSHFSSMSTWWSAADAGVGGTGWLGRYLDGTVGTSDPLAGVTIGQGPSPAMRGDHSFAVTIQDVSGIAPAAPAWIDTKDELLAMWEGFAPAPYDDVATIDRVRKAVAGTVTAAAAVNPMMAGIEDGPSELANSLRIAATLIASPSPPRVLLIHGWGDFDTHQGQEVRHGAMMADLDSSLSEFFDALDAAGVAERTAVMTTSEFGRRAAGNGSGTDHGTAAAQFVIGPGVAAGRYGEAPSLSRLDDRGNLVHAVDLRSYYASVLDGWLGVPSEAILGGVYEALPMF